MKFRYSFDVIAALRDAGYSTYKIRKEGLISEGTLTKLRNGVMISLEQIGVICDLLHCSPWDMVEPYHDDN